MVGRCVLLSLAVSVALTRSDPSCEVAEPQSEFETYRVGKIVSAFATGDDFSSPEAAYATISRYQAAGTGDWKALSCASIIEDFGPGPCRIAIPTVDQARLYRTAEILTVHIYRGTYAHVVARHVEGSRPFDTRSFEWEDGRWLNAGNSRYATLKEAASGFDRWVRRRQDLERIQSRKADGAPEATLARCVAFLRDHGQPPKEHVLEAIQQHALVAIGEIHHRPDYWRLNRDIVQDSRFAEAAGTVYLELPMHAQPLIDKFLAADHLDKMLVIEMLRDNLWTGWPDQGMLDFFVAVWQTNQTLDEGQRIRIVLVDMKRPWSELIGEGDLHKYDRDRDKLMADNILKDVIASPDRRHALFIVGYAHLENSRLAGAERPVANAGWYLRNQPNSDLFSIVQHGPVLTNMGRVFGRTCLGLFDEAFLVAGESPVAFSLRSSPLGSQRYDLNGDRRDLSMSLYSEAFDGYIYPGPLERETFSPLIPDFYTDEFLEQLDQRHRLIFGTDLSESLGLHDVDAQSFTGWMGRSWGHPRDWRYRLGPVTAWRQGDEGNEYLFWCDPPVPASLDADPSTKAGIVRLVDAFFHHNFRDITARNAISWGPVITDANGNSSIIYQFEATIHSGEKNVMTLEFTFAPNGGLISVSQRGQVSAE